MAFRVALSLFIHYTSQRNHAIVWEGHPKFATFLAVVVSPAVVGLLADSLGIDEVSAMNKYFMSAAYAAISDEGQKLWHHSPQLLASLVEEELSTGKFTYPQEAL